MLFENLRLSTNGLEGGREGSPGMYEYLPGWPFHLVASDG